MIKTPEEFKRENIKQLFGKILSSQKVKLEPLKVSVDETWKSDFTTVDLEIQLTKGEVSETVKIKESQAKGFVDGMFKACHQAFAEKCPSLCNLKLVNYELTPSFKKSKNTIGSDASVEVSITMEVKDHGVAEFSSTSRSILHSSVAVTLEAFQFYMNCESTFRKIKLILEDANQRNRGDIAQSCIADLSTLTQVNTYES
tara:strand:+ start:1884 stop:2483 length:600 start_codon:yes stop_codon:yes gene_type:complete